jgi:apolipoprotein N-acyltransferase
MLYALPFLCTNYFSLLILLFPIALMHLCCRDTLSFKEGFFWGFFTVFLQAVGFIVITVQMAQKFWMFGICLALTLVTYYALVAGLLCGIRHLVISYFSIRSRFVKMLSVTIILFIFIIFVDQCSLALFGVWEGYSLFHPAVVFANNTLLLRLVSFVGKNGMLFLLFFIAYLAARIINFSLLRFGLMFLLFCFLSFLLYKLENVYEKQSTIPSIAVLPYMVHGSKGSRSSEAMVKMVKGWLQKISKEHPQVETVIMPESALNGIFTPSDYDSFILWSSKELVRPLQVIFGTMRLINNCYYNSVLSVYDGVVQACFDKSHTMLISERLPCAFAVMQSAYRSNGECEVTCGKNNKKVIDIVAIGQCYLYICSEFFCKEFYGDCFKGRPILVLVNDSVFLDSFGTSYIARLLVQCARLKAVSWSRPIIYVSYSRSFFINQNGLTSRLISF